MMLAYVVILDAIAHLAMLDIAWFINLFFNNLLWVFVFLAAAFIFFEGKKTIAGFFILFIYIWAFVGVSTMTGWIFGGTITMIYFSAAIFLNAWAESDQWVHKNSSVLSTLLFFSVWLGAYFLFGGLG